MDNTAQIIFDHVKKQCKSLEYEDEMLKDAIKKGLEMKKAASVFYEKMEELKSSNLSLLFSSEYCVMLEELEAHYK